jgi:galactose mutarotase-like enzyme
MSVTLENDHLEVSLREKGAELTSIKHRVTNLDYMWSGDPAFWAKTSPILFPIVGTLRNDSFLYRGKFYTLSRHGFARDMMFKVTEQKKNRVNFELQSTASTLEKYPFDFRLRVLYQIDREFLNVTYNVINAGTDDMYFSIGGHPAFKVPLTAETNFEDYYLLFGENENAPRWPIDSNGLIMDRPTQLLENTSKLPLSRNLFSHDALVFKNLVSTKVSIRCNRHEHGLDFNFKGFPYLGIWSARNADFVCIEPWCGLADSVSHYQNLVEKEGVIKLLPAGSWSQSWTVRFY